MSMDGNGFVVETRNLSKSFDDVHALQGLDLKVPKNSIFAFLGPNGAGKSTTIKLLLGLIKPTRGSARVFGLDAQTEDTQIKKRIGYLPQHLSYYEYMTAREVLRFVAGFFFQPGTSGVEDRIQEVLDLLGLHDKADRPVKGFSGGEKQRLGIAQAHLNYPDLLILDEPAAALDPRGRNDVLEIMERLKKHTTIFFSTHILDDAEKVSDHVAILNHGKLVLQAPTHELLASKSGAIYSMVTCGNAQDLHTLFKDTAWIKDAQYTNTDQQTSWTLVVDDESHAQHELLRIALSIPQVDVLSFGRKQYELEDIFLQVTKE